MNGTIYYRIIDKNLIGKCENGKYYLRINGYWIEDTESLIMDRLIGYDRFEEPGSPYGIGNTSIMDSIEEINEEEALELMNQKKDH